MQFKPSKAQTYSLKKGNVKLSEHFMLSEFACKNGANTVKVNPNLVVLLEAIRVHFGKPVIINSGYRTWLYNRRIKGAKNSQHVLGNAADITVKGVANSDVADFVEMIRGVGVGRYHTFTHVDVRGTDARWNG